MARIGANISSLNLQNTSTLITSVGATALSIPAAFQ